MYLLIRIFASCDNSSEVKFTFHYVSINSNSLGATVTLSTLFTFHYVSINSGLLRHLLSRTKSFTFHYVSINSIYNIYHVCFSHYLHSTMYLLIPGIVNKLKYQSKFTFHYVSINSDALLMIIEVLTRFTFHYVSINSPPL